jgi:hypothetical protein
MTAEALLSQLQQVRQSSPGNWVASCPAHEDRTPSMTIRELDDGRVLVHCFAGCSAREILHAAGLDFSVLFPERLSEHIPPMRRPFNAHDVLEAVSAEAGIVATAASNLKAGMMLTQSDYARLQVAAARLEEARRLVNGEC